MSRVTWHTIESVQGETVCPYCEKNFRKIAPKQEFCSVHCREREQVRLAQLDPLVKQAAEMAFFRGKPYNSQRNQQAEGG